VASSTKEKDAGGAAPQAKHSKSNENPTAKAPRGPKGCSHVAVLCGKRDGCPIGAQQADAAGSARDRGHAECQANLERPVTSVLCLRGGERTGGTQHNHVSEPHMFVCF
jgi:hypothetical protein